MNYLALIDHLNQQIKALTIEKECGEYRGEMLDAYFKELKVMEKLHEDSKTKNDHNYHR